MQGDLVVFHAVDVGEDRVAEQAEVAWADLRGFNGGENFFLHAHDVHGVLDASNFVSEGTEDPARAEAGALRGQRLAI